MRAELSRLIGVSILALSISKIVVSVDGFKEGFEGGDRRLGSDKNRALGAKRLRARSAALGSSWMRVGGGGEWEVIIMEQKYVWRLGHTYTRSNKAPSTIHAHVGFTLSAFSQSPAVPLVPFFIHKMEPVADTSLPGLFRPFVFTTPRLYKMLESLCSASRPHPSCSLWSII